jgi:hypothetical protein
MSTWTTHPMPYLLTSLNSTSLMSSPHYLSHPFNIFIAHFDKVVVLRVVHLRDGETFKKWNIIGVPQRGL